MAKWVNEIPIKITSVKRRERKFTLKEKKAIIICGVTWAVLSLLELRLGIELDRPKYTVVLWLVFAVDTIFFIRLFLKMFFDEEELYERYNKEKNNNLIGLDKFWDVLYISDNGIIVTRDTEVGGMNKSILVSLERSNTVGRPPDFEIQHYSYVTSFYRLLLEKGYRFRKYNLSINDTNEQSFELSLNRLNSITNKKMKSTIESIISYNKECVRKVQNRTIEYLLIESGSRSDRIYNDVSEALQLLGNTIYKPEICKKESIIDFLYKYFKQPYIDTKALLNKNLPKTKILKVVASTKVSENKGLFDVVDTSPDKVIEEYRQKRKRILEENK